MSGLSCISHAVCKTNPTFRKTVPVDEWIIGEKTVCFATIFVPLQHYKHLLSREVPKMRFIHIIRYGIALFLLFIGAGIARLQEKRTEF